MAASKDPQGSERHFRLLVEGMVDYAIYMLSPAGIITNWNAGAQRIKGYTSEEAVGQHFSIFYEAADKAAGLPQKALRTALREGRFEAESWRVRKDGSRFLAQVLLSPVFDGEEHIGFAKITRDVTERQKIERALSESERHFRTLVGGVTDYALYMLDPVGHISSWNAGGERIKGYTPVEIIGEHFSKFYTSADRETGRPARALAIAEEVGRYEEDGWRVRKDGTLFWASVVIDPIRDEHGKLIGFAKITRDISERREAHLKLEKLQKQLAESQKMDALGHLTGGVAHDFNNLLMIITGNIQILKKTAADPRSIRAAQAIELAAQRGASLTRQLLTFSRRQAVNPEPVYLPDRVEAIKDVLLSGAGQAELKIAMPMDTWPVVVDATELEMALVNLVVNARDALPKGGAIVIESGNTTLEGKEHVAVCVSDNGEGMSSDIVAKVFDPFFTTKPVGKGTGLGLSQVYGFVHQAGGAIKIESTVGTGTTVKMFFPRASSSVSGQVTEDDLTFRSAGTVLLVEDNPDVAVATSILLEELGYSVRWASNSSAALTEIERNGIDVILSDIVMPGNLDGLGLARAVSSSKPGMPVILATGYSDAASQAAREFTVLRKPYELAELRRALSQVQTQGGRLSFPSSGLRPPR